MYKSIITIRNDISDSELAWMHQEAERGFKTKNFEYDDISDDKYIMIYVSFDTDPASFGFATLKFQEKKDFINKIEAWQWIDTSHPEENEDILKIFNKPVHI